MTSPSYPAPGTSIAPIVPAVYTVTIFLSAALLFFVQPLFAKLVLPIMGGAPAVWTTAMLFFQLVLIGGYLYAHLMTRYLGVTAQMVVHGAVFGLALLFLPLGVPEGWRYDPTGSTVAQTLLLFAAGVGVPFALLSANAPLIQAWYARSGGPSAHDPYFLYGASNLGSLIALLSFPLVAEPLFGALDIGIGWATGFILLGALLLATGTLARGDGSAPRLVAPATCTGSMEMVPPKARDIGRWLFLAFVPSSLMLAVTAKISTDLGSFPLLWTIPLSLYLLTFVLSFTKRLLLPKRLLDFLFLIGFVGLASLVIGMWGGAMTFRAAILAVACFFVVALKAHCRLYEVRPHGRDLTLFYVAISVGGAFGGIFNSIIAPLLFDNLYESAVTLALASLLFVAGDRRDLARSAGLGIVAGMLALAPLAYWAANGAGVNLNVALTLSWAFFALALYGLRRRGSAAVAMAVVVIGSAVAIPQGDAIYRDRSFFGTHKVANSGLMRLYTNGTTVHGAQLIEELGAERPTALYYYHPVGPMAQIMTSDVAHESARIGVVGLGVGSLSCYARPGQEWHFYEIDAKVDAIARDPALFTFLSSCMPEAPTHLGDARVVLDGQDLLFDILVIDAYSSDAVPVHLTTTEALALYRDRLRPGGVIVFHISNRYYNIAKPLGRSAAHLGLAARHRKHPGGDESLPDGAAASEVVVMAEDLATLARLPGANAYWQPLPDDGRRLWTDDYANLMSILK